MSQKMDRLKIRKDRQLERAYLNCLILVFDLKTTTKRKREILSVQIQNNLRIIFEPVVVSD